jgi:hypothetical protein
MTQSTKVLLIAVIVLWGVGIVLISFGEIGSPMQFAGLAVWAGALVIMGVILRKEGLGR